MKWFKWRKNKKEKKSKKGNQEIINENVVDKGFDSHLNQISPESLNQINSPISPIQNEEFVFEENNELDQPSKSLSIDDAIRLSILRNNQTHLFKKDESYFLKNDKKIYEVNESPIDLYGVPLDIRFDESEAVNKNLDYQNLYLKRDIDNFNLSEDHFFKHYQNGSIFYKLKNFDYNSDVFSFFKNDTKFLLTQKQSDENKFINNLKRGQVFSEWEENDIFKLLNLENENDSFKQQELKNKIYALNKELEERIKNLNNDEINEKNVDEISYAKQVIIEKQNEISDKLYELKQDFANTEILYKVQNLYCVPIDQNSPYFSYKIENINFNIHPHDSIVIISDDSITNQLLIDVLRGDELKTSGYVYKNLVRKNQWVDVENEDFNYSRINAIELNDELKYGLISPNYLSFGLKKKDNVAVSMKKIFQSLEKNINESIKEKLISLFNFESELNKNVFELNDLNLEKFNTICDILIGKKLILMKSVCQGMAFNQKMELLNFLNKYFIKNNVTLVYASDDLNDINLIANKVIVLKAGQIVGYDSIENILTQFESINNYVIYCFKYVELKDYSQIEETSEVSEVENIEDIVD
ncbi:MAG: hypothetical protein HUJ42_03165 [Malacoplasma sp.]|nr:hypothetical protein [Malacoplasma sp.]